MGIFDSKPEEIAEESPEVSEEVVEKKAVIVQLMIDGKLEDCEVKPGRNGEVICEAANGRMIKFAAEQNLQDGVNAHNKANS